MNIERQILGSILYNENECDFAFEHLTPEHFRDKFHRSIYEIMQKLRQDGKEITLISIGERPDVSDWAMEVSSEVVTTGGIRTHCDMLIDAYYLNVAKRGGEWLAEEAQKQGATPRSIFEVIEKLALKMSDRVGQRGLEHISKVGHRVLTELDEITQGKIPGVSTGFQSLDSNGFMFRNGTFNVIASRPSMGKSSLALDIAEQSNVNVAFFSLEMTAEELYERQISSRTGISNDDLRDAPLIKYNSSSIMTAVESINGHKIWIDDGAYKTPFQILNQGKRLKAQHGIGLIIIDYIQLMKLGGKIESRRQEVGEISKILKTTAKELDIPVVALAQLNRDCEQRPDKRPLLSDLKESGELEQDAHQVWFIFREEVYDESAEPNKAEILIRKNRSGRIGKVNLTFHKEKTHFTDYVPPPNDGFDDPIPKPTSEERRRRVFNYKARNSSGD